MPTEIIGTYPSVTRKATGFPSLDVALCGGAPQGQTWELFGWSQSGKTSLGIALAAQTSGDIAFAEVENRLNIDYLRIGLDSGGHNAKCYLLPIKEPAKDEILTHAERIQDFTTVLREPNFTAGIWDSLGAIIPVEEVDEDPDKGYHTGRAKLVWALLRKLAYTLQRGRPRSAPRVSGVYLINHEMTPITGRGILTAGGKGTEYLSAIRLKMWCEAKDPNDGSLEIAGKVNKLTYGPVGGQFHLYLIPDFGLHRGLSAMLDCSTLKLCKRESYGVMMAGKSVGKLGSLKAAALAGDDEIFKPFVDALATFYKTGSITDAEAAAKAARKPITAKKAANRKPITAKKAVNGRRKKVAK